MEFKDNIEENIHTKNFKFLFEDLECDQPFFNIIENAINKIKLIIIILLFMFLSKIWNVVWHIGKIIVYIIIILYLINFINADLFNNFTNISKYSDFLFELINKIISIIKKFFNVKKIKQKTIEPVYSDQESTQSEQKPTQSEQEQSKVCTDTIIKTIEIFSNLLNNHGSSNNGNVKNFANIQRKSNKNFFF
jgi:hypothetical protein